MSESAPANQPALRRLLLEAVVICAVAMAVGLSMNFKMVMNAFTGKTVAAPPIRTEQVSVAEFPDPVELDEVRELIAGGGLLVDARHAEDYREAHLQGAVSLPLGEVDQRLDAFRSEVNAERVIITYCNGFGCPDSFDLGVILLQKGFQQVRVFEGGFPEWRDAGLPLAGAGQ
ncbi:MAG: rhodanese-like domain-containing protein [Desulfuromonadales bacterium]|jgi:rhodanese-related sulfurtransferase|nr:rhodanese-like domain-containing protein [Desulfuromonadales bacterium]